MFSKKKCMLSPVPLFVSNNVQNRLTKKFKSLLQIPKKCGTMDYALAIYVCVLAALSKELWKMSNIVVYSGFQPMSLFGLFRLTSLPGLLRASPIS